MYRHCIYCSGRLGANETLEAFPVGRMLAFDAAKGRLWAVCPKCARWNLAPIEERWEAVEEAEKRYADSRVRVQRENIGIASLRDGTRLVRVGSAPAGELAAWRYGEPLRRRHRRTALAWRLGGLGAVGQAAVWGAWQVGWIGAGLALMPLAAAPMFAYAALSERPRGGGRIHRLPRGAAKGLPAMTLRRRDLNGAVVWPGEDGGLEMELPRVYPPLWRGLASRRVRLRGEPAERLLEKALVIRNWQGGAADSIGQAHALRTEAGSVDAILRIPLRRHRRAVPKPLHLGIDYAHPRQGFLPRPPQARDGTGLLPVELLALEMALHEERERRALEGELVLLESAWREAEEIAAIADRLAGEALPPGRGPAEDR